MHLVLPHLLNFLHPIFVHIRYYWLSTHLFAFLKWLLGLLDQFHPLSYLWNFHDLGYLDHFHLRVFIYYIRHLESLDYLNLLNIFYQVHLLEYLDHFDNLGYLNPFNIIWTDFVGLLWSIIRILICWFSGSLVNWYYDRLIFNEMHTVRKSSPYGQYTPDLKLSFLVFLWSHCWVHDRRE